MTQAASGYDHFYILRNLVEKDFKVRYRNMSLGVFWSLVNPLVMMGVLSFVFGIVFPLDRPHSPLFLLCGLLPYNFFNLAWLTGTRSVVDNAAFVKRVPFRRELLPVSVVLGNLVHYGIQLGLLLIVAFFMVGFSVHWLWLPIVVILQVVFVCGMSLLTSGLNVYYRDIQYVVESINMVLFWLVPIFYGFDNVPADYVWIYEYNPLAAVIFVSRRILIQGVPPPLFTTLKMVAVSLTSLGVGAYVFGRIKKNFADFL